MSPTSGRSTLTHTLALALAGAVLATSGCARTPDPGTPVTVPAPSTTPAPTPSATAAPAPIQSLEVVLDPVARGLDGPLFATHAGDGSGRLFIVEQSGRVRVLRKGGVASGSFLDVRKLVSSGGERGLLGLAFAPDFATSGAFYVNYTDRSGDTVVARFIADDPASDAPKVEGPTRILKVSQPYANHNGGCIVFQPGTQRLWVGMGDGGSGGDPGDRAQDTGELLGKMLVLDFSAGERPTPQIVQRGVRNPWRFSFDRETHDLWIGDVGQNAWEEIDFVPLAEVSRVNWGWRRWEGNHAYPSGSNPSRKGMRFPITEYGRDRGGSVTGGYVYRGSAYPALVGTYLFADFSGGWIAGLQRLDETGATLPEPRERVLVESAGNPASFGEDEDGELYVCDLGGTLYRVTATAK